jgi:hypothetical protein
MSNTATVSPYDDSSQTSLSEGVVAGAILGGAAVAATAAIAGITATAAAMKWLCEDTPQQKSALQKAREEDKEMLVRETLRLSSVALTLRDERAFAQSAEAVGFRPRAVAGSVLMLESATGVRLAVAKSPSGRLVVHSNGGRKVVAEVVSRHNLEHSKKHLKALGMDLTERKTASGEIELVGVERRESHGDGRAAVSLRVRRDGSLSVDVDGIAGSRCEQLVAGIASATGGEVTKMERKRSYFERPGEATRTKVRV